MGLKISMMSRKQDNNIGSLLQNQELMDPRARLQLSFEWTLPQSSSVSFHNLQGVEMELAMV